MSAMSDSPTAPVGADPRPRLVFLDVDGTLVDYELRLPESAVAAVRGARARGHRVYLCTGRSRAEVYQELWDIGVDGLIGANGGYVESDGQVVRHQHLSAQQTREIVDWLGERGLEFYLESNSGLYGSARFATAAEPTIRAYARGKGTAGADRLSVADVFPEMIHGQDPYCDDVNKISFILGSPTDAADAAARFPELLSGTWGGRGADALFGDLALAGIDKASSVRALVEHLGVDPDDTIAMGDAVVDLPMFEACAVSVAMGNAPDHVQAAADLVTDDVEADGLAHAFQRLGLLG